MKRITAIFAAVSAIFALGVSATFYLGKDLLIALPAAHHGATTPASVWSALLQNFHDPLSRLLVQFIVIIIAARIVGKVFVRFGQPAVIGEMTAGTGMSWNEAFSLGALMNTRGLVELIALNIGYDLGILPPRIFFHDGADGAGHDLHDRPAAQPGELG